MNFYVKDNTKFHISEVRRANPNTSIPDGGDASSIGYAWFIPSEPPLAEPWHRVEESAPVNNTQTWVQVPMNASEIVNDVAARVQQRLDAFAQTRNYSTILSATTYAASSVPKFQAEGEYCVTQRDSTWAKLYEIMNEVETGARPMPVSYAQIEAELPVLVWP